MTRADGPEGPYLILGCGRSGTSAAEALTASTGTDRVRVWDPLDVPATRARAAPLRERGIAVALGPWRDELFDAPTPATVVKSPGIAPDEPPVREALARGVPVLDELALGASLSRRRLVAVTGTDGKSTVSALLAAALGEADGPAPVSGNTEFGATMSALAPTGGRVVVEASSYQLEFCPRPFAELAVLTNLTLEHQERHRDMAAYGAIKRRLFVGDGRVVPRAVVNVDAAFGRGLADELRAMGAIVAAFGSGPEADHRVLEARWDAVGATVRIATPTGEVLLRTLLPGSHNAENVCAALAACDLLGLPRDRALRALGSFAGVPGRWQRIDGGQPFDAIVDFAHTEDALTRVLTAARAVAAERLGARVRLVLCAPGGIERAKRQPLGRIAATFADDVVLTEGNGRGEPREDVIDAVLAGTRDGRASVTVVPDRRAAIAHALASAGAGDLVLVTGRGAQARLLADRAGDGIPFDDRVVVGEELARLAAANPAASAR